MQEVQIVLAVAMIIAVLDTPAHILFKFFVCFIMVVRCWESYLEIKEEETSN